MTDIIKHPEYRDWLHNLKLQIKTGQIKAALSVNSQMIMLYWDLGRQIVEKQENAKWGSGFVEQLSKDLKEEFPEMAGFSRTNLFRMKRFYQFYSPVIQYNEFVPQVVEQIQHAVNQTNITCEQFISKVVLIPWGHNVTIFEKTKTIDQAFFYINKTIENNWSRTVLDYQIESCHCGLDPQSIERGRNVA